MREATLVLSSAVSGVGCCAAKDTACALRSASANELASSELASEPSSSPARSTRELMIPSRLKRESTSPLAVMERRRLKYTASSLHSTYGSSYSAPTRICAEIHSLPLSQEQLAPLRVSSVCMIHKTSVSSVCMIHKTSVSSVYSKMIHDTHGQPSFASWRTHIGDGRFVLAHPTLTREAQRLSAQLIEH